MISLCIIEKRTTIRLLIGLTHVGNGGGASKDPEDPDVGLSGCCRQLFHTVHWDTSRVVSGCLLVLSKRGPHVATTVPPRRFLGALIPTRYCCTSRYFRIVVVRIKHMEHVHEKMAKAYSPLQLMNRKDCNRVMAVSHNSWPPPYVHGWIC